MNVVAALVCIVLEKDYSALAMQTILDKAFDIVVVVIVVIDDDVVAIVHQRLFLKIVSRRKRLVAVVLG